jgi:hypothetical protein
MWKFYRSLLGDIPDIFRSNFEAVAFWLLAFAIPIALWIWPGWRSVIDTSNPWIVLVPTALMFGYAVLRANYQRFLKLEEQLRQANMAIEAKEDRIAKSAALGKYRNIFLNIQLVGCRTSGDPSELQKMLETNMDAVHRFVSEHFDEGQASLLRPATLGPRDEMADKLEATGRADFVYLYMGAQYQANAIGRLIERINP